MPKVKDLSDVSPHSHEDSFVFFDSREDNVTTSISVADIIRMREMAFDRWNWETGDEKDKALLGGRKFKIGNRSGGKPANTLSTADLQAVLENADKKRYHAKVRAVLTNRGVAV